MNKKRYFLIIFLTSISFTILANNSISSRVIAAQKEYILSKLIEMHSNKQMTKENLDVLKNAMQIESFEKILVHKHALLLPTFKSYTWTAIKGLVCSIGLLIGINTTKDVTFVINGMFNRQAPQMPKKIQELWSAAIKASKEIIAYRIIMSLIGPGTATISSYYLQKIYYQERDRRNTLKIIDEIIKELKQLEIA